MKTTKRIFVLLCLMVVTMGAWAQQWQLYSSGYCLGDNKWQQMCVIPETEENTDNHTTIRYMAHHGNSCSTSTWKPGLAQTKDTRNEHWLTMSNTDNTFSFNTVENVSAAVMKVVFDFTGHQVTVTKATSFDVLIGSALATTLVLPADATIPSGVRAYTLEYDAVKTCLNAKKVSETLPANTPVLLNADNAGNYSFSFAENYTASYTTTSPETGRYYINDVTSENNDLYGLFQPHYVPENSYVLQNGASGIGFYKVNVNNYAINPFRCYIPSSAIPAGARSLSIVFDDGETTGIADVRGQKEDVRSDIFNLSGQRVGKDYKGVVIKNGRKMIQK